MDSAKEIKTMKLYHHIERINKELKELGYSDKDSVKVDDLCKFDQMHYYGTKAVDEAVAMLGVSSAHRILDIGSGLGGPARYLVYKTNCSIVGLELQEDLHKEGEALTRRCNLQYKLKHLAGDILQLDLGANSFDFIVSWLVFLHIEDRKRLFEWCFHHLNPDGKMFIEDYFQKSGVSLTEEQTKMYKDDLYINNLPEKDVYVEQLQTAGFEVQQFEDLTESWASFVTERHKEFCQQKERHVRVLGKDAFDDLEYFYSKVRYVFSNKLSGGCRIVATKPAM